MDTNLKPGDKLYGGTVLSANEAAGEVIHVIEPYESPEKPGLVEVVITPPTERWPRPIPVSKLLPEQYHFGGECDGDSFEVLAYQENTEQWGEAVYSHTKSEWRFFDDWHLCRQELVTHWLPLPPKPE